MIIARGSTLGRGCGIVWGVGGARGRRKGTPSRRRGTCSNMITASLSHVNHARTILFTTAESRTAKNCSHERERERERQVEIMDRKRNGRERVRG